jgi:hypothetical protein
MKTLCSIKLKTDPDAPVIIPVEVLYELPGRFGRRDFMVSPVGGEGEFVVTSTKLREIPAPGSLSVLMSRAK